MQGVPPTKGKIAKVEVEVEVTGGKIFVEEAEEEPCIMEMREITTKVILNLLNAMIARKEVILKRIVGTKTSPQLCLNVQFVTNLDMKKRIAGIKTKIKQISMKKRQMMKLRKIYFSHVYLQMLNLLEIFGFWIVGAVTT